MGIKSETQNQIQAIKKVKSTLKKGADALVGHEALDDEESLLQKQQDKSEGEAGKGAKSGNGVPKVMISEAGRQAFWFLIVLVSLVSCQVGLALSFLGGVLRPALENHDVIMKHYGKMDATLNVGKAGSFIVIVGLMMVKGSAFQLVAALLARQKRKSRRRFAVKIAFGCVLFEVVFISLMCTVTGLLAAWLAAFHQVYRETLPRALVNGYLRNVSITRYVNWLQPHFRCCGVTDFRDWFIADWQHREWLVNRFPAVPYYRDKIYAAGPQVERYPEWREMSLMTNYEHSSTTRLAYLQDRANGLVNDSLINEYVNATSYAEVPFSCCRLDSLSTWCTRQFVVFKLYAYDFKLNSTIYQRGCPKQVEEYINSRVHGIGVALLVLISVRLLNLLTLRLAQTSTFNALVARRHLSPAFGWLLTTLKPQVVPNYDEERYLLEEELLSDTSHSDLSTGDELDEWDGNDDIDSDLDLSEQLTSSEYQSETGTSSDYQSETGTSSDYQSETGSEPTDQTSEDTDVSTEADTSADWETTEMTEVSATDGEASDDLTDITTLLSP